MGDYAYLVMMDIPEEMEDEFNRIYDTQHVPNIVKAPGVPQRTSISPASPSSTSFIFRSTIRTSTPGTARPMESGWRSCSCGCNAVTVPVSVPA